MQDKNVTIVNFSQRFTTLLKNSGMKQAEVADKAGVSKTAIVHYKNGRSIPSGMELYKLAKFFGCSMEWLLTGEGDGKPENKDSLIWKAKAEDAEKRLEELKSSIIIKIKKI